jgi:uncharacterized protein (TIGR02001 family)
MTRRPGIPADRHAAALAVAGLLAAAAAKAEPADPAIDSAGVTVSGTVALTSDYRFRGISQTDIAPAIQPALQLDTPGGLFAGVWGSNVAEFNGATTEIDLTAGWAGSLAGLDTSVGILAYLYPGGDGTDVYEFFGTIGMPIGPVSASLGLNWSPNQPNSGASRYLYAALSAAIPGTPLTLNATLGHERGGFVFDEAGATTAKWDWMLGLNYSLTAVTLGVAYVGTDLPGRDPLGTRINRAGRDAVVLTLSAAF